MGAAAAVGAVFGDTRVVIGGAVRYDHGRGGSEMSVNGAFKALPFHFQASVVHEVVGRRQALHVLRRRHAASTASARARRWY